MQLIDSEKLSELKDLSNGNDELLINLLDKYIVNSGTFIEKIKQSLKNQDYEQVQFSIHTLKGSSLSLGLKDLGQLFTDLNSRAKKGDYANFEQEIGRAETMLKDVVNYRKSLS